MKYLEQIKEDIVSFIIDNGIKVTENNRMDIYVRLYDDLWAEDSVTGNGSGSYTFSSYLAKQYVLEDGEDYIRELIEEFGVDAKTIADHIFDWEFWDVSIRCYLLGQAIEEAIEELVAPIR